MENIGKINISIYQPVTENKILTDKVVLTNNRREHIIERRGQAFSISIRRCLPTLLPTPIIYLKTKIKILLLRQKLFRTASTRCIFAYGWLLREKIPNITTQ